MKNDSPDTNKGLAIRGTFGHQIQNLFQDFFRDLADPWEERSLWSTANEFVPRMNISETDNAYKVVVDLPGMEEKDFDVTVEDNILRIKGERKSESENKGEHFHRYESSYGSFERALRLPEAINSDACKANFKNGVLTLEIPKSKEASKVKKLKISH